MDNSTEFSEGVITLDSEKGELEINPENGRNQTFEIQMEDCKYVQRGQDMASGIRIVCGDVEYE